MTDQADDKKIAFSGEKRTALPEWKIFDAQWYRRRYQAVLSEEEKQADDAALEKIWCDTTSKTGRSPNRFFDEEWYLSYNREVGRVIQAGSIFETGFQHYEEIGFGGCAPHWLFREEDYFRQNPDLSYRALLSAGFVNGYDHYISVGDKEARQANLFFQPDLFVSQAMREGLFIENSQGPFSSFLALESAPLGRIRSSWYFDPKWYLNRYPEVEELLRNGRYGLPLEHYLCNQEPVRFDPNPYFSETYYLAQYPDIERAINDGHYRNGYEHFLAAGLYEGRHPAPSIELDRELMKGENAYRLINHNVRDAFAFYIKQKEENFPEERISCSVESARKLAVMRLEAQLPALYRKPLVFAPSRKPDISVILFSEGDYLSVTASLISLYEQGFREQEIIIVTRGTISEQKRLEKTFQNILIMASSEWKTEKALFSEGVKRAHSKNILLMYAGVTLHQKALPVILSQLRIRSISGGGGQVLSVNQNILETGIHLYRDGSHRVYGMGERAFAAAISFARQVDGFQKGVFFARKFDLQPVLSELAPFDDKTGFLYLTVLLSSRGKKLLYCPDLVVTDPETMCVFDDLSLVSDQIRRDFPAYVAERPLPSDKLVALVRPKKKKTALLVFQRLPLKAEDGFSRRAFDLMDLLDEEGWDVTLLALHAGVEDRLAPLQSYRSSVKWFVGETYLEEFIVKGKGEFDLIWLNGSVVANRLLPMAKSSLLSSQDFILDLTNPDGSGLPAAERYLRCSVGRQEDLELFFKELRQDLSESWVCRAVITDNEWEARYIRQLESFNVLVIPNRCRSLNFIPQWEGRTGLLFPIPIHKSGDAAHDAFDWFCLKVAPVLRDMLSKEIPIWVGSYHNPDVDLGFYERFTPVKGLATLQSLEDKMAQCRLAIVPTRVMTTIPPEIMDVIGAGLPTIMSSSVFEGMKLSAHEAKDAGFNDPLAFASAIAELYKNEDLWTKMSQAGSRKVLKTYNQKRFRDAVIGLLSQLENALFHVDGLKKEESSSRYHFQPAPLIFFGDDPDEISGEPEEMEIIDREPDIKLGVTLET